MTLDVCSKQTWSESTLLVESACFHIERDKVYLTVTWDTGEYYGPEDLASPEGPRHR